MGTTERRFEFVNDSEIIEDDNVNYVIFSEVSDTEYCNIQFRRILLE